MKRFKTCALSMTSSSSSSSTSLLSLPRELQQEVLSRAPAEAVIRSRPMCKKWTALIDALLTSKAFICKHLEHSAERFIRTVDKVIVADPVTRTRSTSPVPHEFQDGNDIDILLHCDGLLLCRRTGSHVKRFEPKKKKEEDPNPKPPQMQIAIWNPVLREVNWIMPSHSESRYNNFGLGYKNRGDYMILRFPQIKFKFVDGETPVEIYELKNNSWRTLEKVKVDWVVDRSCQGVSVLGNMYWLAEKKPKSYILGFDFTKETFKNVCLRPPSTGGESYLSCFRESRLSLLQQAEGSKKIEVWVTDKLADACLSFTKYFTVASPALPLLKPHGYTAYPVYCFVKPKTIVAWCEGDETQGQRHCTYCTLYEIGKDGLRDSTETERNYPEKLLPDICGHVYVPSLVSL